MYHRSSPRVNAKARLDRGVNLNPTWGTCSRPYQWARTLLAPVVPTDPANITERQRAYREGRQDGRKLAGGPATAGQGLGAPFTNAPAKILEAAGTNQAIRGLVLHTEMWPAAAHPLGSPPAMAGGGPLDCSTL